MSDKEILGDVLNEETPADEDSWFETEEPTDEEQANEEAIEARVSWRSQIVSQFVIHKWQLRVAFW